MKAKEDTNRSKDKGENKDEEFNLNYYLAEDQAEKESCLQEIPKKKVKERKLLMV